MFCGLFMWDYSYKNEITRVIHWMFVTWCNVVGWLLFCGGSVSDAVGGRGIGCRIGSTSPRSCFTGQGVAQSFFVGNVSPSASSPGYCGWCADTFQPELAARSRAAQLVDGSLGTLHGGWVQPKNVLWHDLFLWPNMNVCHMVRWRCKTLQDNARRCKIMQDNARRCKAMEGDARWCNMMQEDARWCVTSTITRKWRMLYTPSWYRAFLCHLRGFLHNKMNYHVSYTASWYRAVLSHLWEISIRKWNDICQTWHHVCEIPGIDKEISSTFVASLEVSVGAVREISRLA